MNPQAIVSAVSIDKTRLGITLQRIVKDIVESLGFVGAMVALLEDGGALPVYAFDIDPHLATKDQVSRWEQRISKLMRKPISISDPKLARVYVHDKQYKDNLSVQAFHKEKVVVSNDLFSLFTPIVPSNKLTRPVVNGIIQPALNIKQVVAVPFFLDSANGEKPIIVGNLFAAKREDITAQDVKILTSFGRYAAAAIEIERHRTQVLHVAKHLTTEIQTKIAKEEDVLQQIVEGVVSVLGYVGAMVATYDQDNDSLPVQAFYVDPKLATSTQITSWEGRLTKLLGRKISVSDPEVARVFINKPGYEDNLSVEAVRQGKPVTNNDLSTLFTPIVPVNKLTKPVISLIQRVLNISQVIAIPFFLVAADGSDPQIVGNLFVATTHPSGFHHEEIDLLQAFGQQAAAGIFNAQLYREIDEQRQVAQVFGTMAFSASKAVHQFRNDIGFIRGQLQLLPYFGQFPDAQRAEIIASTPKVIERLDIIRDRLEQLHEPWRPVEHRPTSVNTCIVNARNKVIPEHAETAVSVRIQVDGTLPLVEASPDMLTEAFSILIKNGIEAIQDKDNHDGVLRLSTAVSANHIIIEIEDNGFGIKEENFNKIFNMRWSTKES
ncbi:MAG: GAF domain-containing protein, partial [Chloroflexi bacterium]|nr:GAF domain-containing protein [Chloroflexota bacterium]